MLILLFHLEKEGGWKMEDNFKTELEKDVEKEIKEQQKDQDDYFGKGSEEVRR